MGEAYVDYYKRNKKEILAKRKKKYDSDPEHAEKIRAKARKYWTDNNPPKGDPVRTEVRTSDGTLFLSVGGLSKKVGRSASTIRECIRNGLIPEATVWSEEGWRLYTPAQVELVIASFKRFDDKELKSMKEVAKELYNSWEEEA